MEQKYVHAVSAEENQSLLDRPAENVTSVQLYHSDTKQTVYEEWVFYKIPFRHEECKSRKCCPTDSWGGNFRVANTIPSTNVSR